MLRPCLHGPELAAKGYGFHIFSISERFVFLVSERALGLSAAIACSPIASQVTAADRGRALVGNEVDGARIRWGKVRR